MFKKGVLIFLSIFTLLCIHGCGELGINKLSPEKQEIIYKFLAETTNTANVYETSNSLLQNPEIKNLAEEIVQIGRPAVPYIINAIGYGRESIYGEKKYGYHSHYWQIVVLTRIGGRSSVNGLIKILKYKYTGSSSGSIAWSSYFKNDRIMAAQALVALGVKEAIPQLERVIGEMKKEANISDDNKRTTAPLERELSKLRRGEGIRDASNFPYLPRLQVVRTGKEKEIRQLMDKIEKLTSWQPNNRETQKLINIGKPAVVPLINALGAGDVDSQMTADIYIYILGEIADKQAVSILSDVVRESGIRIDIGYLTSSSFREGGAIALAKIGSTEAIAPLSIALNSEVRIIKNTTGIKPIHADALAEIVLAIQKLAEKQEPLTPEAKESLKDIEEKAIPTLIDDLKAEHPFTRSDAAKSLGKIRANQAVPVLIEALEDKNESVRFSAAGALGQIKDKKSIPPLIEALKKEREGRLDITNAVAMIGVEVIDYLLPLLDSGNRIWQDKSLGVLKELPEYTTQDESRKLLSHNYYQVRSAAALSLGTKKDESAVPVLIELLKDSSSQRRGLAALYLGKIEDRAAISPLKELLNDEDMLSYFLDSPWKLIVLVNYSVGIQAALSLVELDDASGLNLVWKSFLQTEGYGKIIPAKALIKLNQKGWMAPLIIELENPQKKEEIKTALFELTARTGEGYNNCIKLGEDKFKSAYRQDPPNEAIIEEFEKSPKWEQRLNSFIDTKENISELIERLKSDDLTEVLGTAITLYKKTYQNFGDDYQKWEKWQSLPATKNQRGKPANF